jgi:O-antigen ligase
VPEHYYTNWDRAPHNLVLQTVTELGVVGLVLLAIAFWYQIRSLRIIPPEHALYPIRVALEASYLGIGIASIFLDVLEYKYFWLLLIATVLVRNAAVAEGARIRERTVSPVLQTAPHRG